TRPTINNRTELDQPIRSTKGAARTRPRHWVRIRPPPARRAARSASHPPSAAPGTLASGQSVEVKAEKVRPCANNLSTSDGSQARKVAATKFAPTNTHSNSNAAGLPTMIAILDPSEDGGAISGQSPESPDEDASPASSVVERPLAGSTRHAPS